MNDSSCLACVWSSHGDCYDVGCQTLGCPQLHAVSRLQTTINTPNIHSFTLSSMNTTMSARLGTRRPLPMFVSFTNRGGKQHMYSQRNILHSCTLAFNKLQTSKHFINMIGSNPSQAFNLIQRHQLLVPSPQDPTPDKPRQPYLRLITGVLGSGNTKDIIKLL